MNKLVVVWKSDHDIDIHNFVIPYVLNSKKKQWFDDVELLIWGASQKKVIEDQSVLDKVRMIIQNNIRVLACKMCADNIQATKLLEENGVEVTYTGTYLSEQLISDHTKVLTI